MLHSAHLSAWFIIIGSASLLLILIFFFLLLLQYSRRKYEHLKEVYSIRKNYEQALLQAQLEIQEQTFSHISQEIHDNIGQVLSLVRLNINTLELHSKEKIHTTDALLGKAISDLRALSHSLNTNFIKEAGFTEAVKQLVAHLQKTGRYQTVFAASEALFDISEEKGIILFRMVQEVINNIIHHANASHIHITLEESAEHMQICIADNGKGFDTAVLNGKEAGLGLRSITSRAAMIGATVDIRSIVDEGTTVTIRL